MKSFYVGAFTKMEIELISELIYQINETYDKDAKILYINRYGLFNNNDLHLFSGGSDFCKFKVDINRKSNANIVKTVQEFLALCIQRGIKFDFIIFDPPYNARYDKLYGTHCINRIGDDDGSKFLGWLVNECLKILNIGGFIVSKNWRSIDLPNSTEIFRFISLYGGFRRCTLLECFQYKPTERDGFNFRYNHSQKIKWVLSEEEGFSEREIELIQENQDGETILISDDDLNPFDFELNVAAPEDFLNLGKKFNTIILGKCRKIGGNTRLTSALKERLAESLYDNGHLITKTYFSPTMDKFDGIKLKRKLLVLYDKYRKIDLLHIYKKVKNSF